LIILELQFVQKGPGMAARYPTATKERGVPRTAR
jgi:hypothetical protein